VATNASFAEALANGSPAPDVTLTLEDGFSLHISAERGKPVALFFCTSQRDPECIREARAVKQGWGRLHAQHVVVIGVTPEDAPAHRAFIADQELPFDLASDTDGRIALAFRIQSSGAVASRAVLVSSDGRIRHSWSATSPESIVSEMLTLTGD